MLVRFHRLKEVRSVVTLRSVNVSSNKTQNMGFTGRITQVKNKRLTGKHMDFLFLF